MNVRVFGLGAVVVLVAGSILLGGCQSTSSVFRPNVVKATATDPTRDFHMLLQNAQLDKTLASKGPYTIFAPSDDAFNRLPQGKLQDLQKPQNNQQLVSLLTYHIVPGEYNSRSFRDGMELTTLKGDKVTIHLRDGQWFYGDARIIIPDRKADNGAVMVVNKVLSPPGGPDITK